MDEHATFAQSPGCEVSQMSDGLVLYQPAREKVHYLNPTASLIYDLCAEAPSEAMIAAFLQEAFSLNESPRAEVARCVSDLIAEDLIVRC